MKFDDLDTKLRVYETNSDSCVLPGMHMVVRLDGRGFTRLTKNVLKLEAPFDPRFQWAMADTTAFLMTSGFRVVYGYTQSDEISLLLHRDDETFGRKRRKILSILAGEASAKFTQVMQAIGVFDCRISEFPTDDLVVDYFRWRQEDAHRNALNAHCYWLLRKEFMSASVASTQLRGMPASAKNELLFSRGINFNELPTWQRRGVGVSWKAHEMPAVNQKTDAAVVVSRRGIVKDCALPLKDEYSAYIRSLLKGGDA